MNKKKVKCFVCLADKSSCTYCAIDAGQQFAIELHHRIDSSFHLLLSHSLQLTCRKELNVCQSVCSANTQCYKFNVNLNEHLQDLSWAGWERNVGKGEKE